MVMDDYFSAAEKNSKTNVLAKTIAKEINCAYWSENAGCGDLVARSSRSALGTSIFGSFGRIGSRC
jgi:hypothetical protein